MSPSDDQEVQAQRTRQHKDDEGRLRRWAVLKAASSFSAASHLGTYKMTGIKLHRQVLSCAGRDGEGLRFGRNEGPLLNCALLWPQAWGIASRASMA